MNIKFRAWHRELNLMRNVDAISFGVNAGILVRKNENLLSSTDLWSCRLVELMQYTGLQDLDQKDIYCGDIVSLDQDNILIFKVEWDEESAAFKLVTLESKPSGFYFSAIGVCPTKVLGNIYENEELLRNDNAPVQEL